MVNTRQSVSMHIDRHTLIRRRGRITSDVWSIALTVLEVALNRFPFPSNGEAPLNGPIELLTYLIKMDSPVKVLLADEAGGEGVKYTNAFKNFVGVWSVYAYSPARVTADTRYDTTASTRILRLVLRRNDYYLTAGYDGVLNGIRRLISVAG